MSRTGTLELHQVSGIYPDRSTAKTVFNRLRERGFEPGQVRLIAPHDADVKRKLGTDVRSAELSVAGNLLLGAAVGGGAGFLLVLVLQSLSDSFLDSAPIFSGVVFTLLGALVGAFAWSVHGMRMHAPESSALVNDAVRHGHWAVTVITPDDDAAREARELVSSTMLDTQSGQLAVLAERVRRSRTSHNPLLRTHTIDPQRK